MNMAKQVSRFLAISALSLAAVTASAVWAGFGKQALGSVSYDMPIPDPYSSEPSLPNKLVRLAEDGTFSDGENELSSINDVIAFSTEDGATHIDLLIAGGAKFGQTVGILQNLSAHSLTIVGAKAHQKFGKNVIGKLNDKLDLQFHGPVGKLELPVVVAYSASDGACLASLFGRDHSSDELFDRAFKTLDGWVQGAGGIEAFVRDNPNLEGLSARIQAPSDTPWRCVAGAMYSVQVAGFPRVKFEIVE